MKNSRRVVITGLGVVSPIGIGKDAFWQNLIAGKSGVDYITAFDPSPYPCHVAAEVKDFNPSDFLASKKARQMGRFSQFAVAATRLALDDAKLQITSSLSPQVAICYGNSVNGCGDIAAEAFAAQHMNSDLKPWAVLEYPVHASSSYIAIEMGIKGPAISISTNCCTGLDAIQSGFSLISAGKARVAIVGGCDTPIFPLTFAGFCALGALTKRNEVPTQASRPYDALRDGIVIAEGAATLLLEDLEFAQNRGAPIYAEVLGHAAASEAIGMRKGDLSGKVMANVLSAAIKASSLTPADIDHINAHGSSLPDYDICDSNAFKIALGDHAYRIPVSSIKSMIGQPVSAAGALQAVAACLSIRHQIAPPTINQTVRDPQCDLDYVPNAARIARIKHVLINGHSFGGSVSGLVIGRHDS